MDANPFPVTLRIEIHARDPGAAYRALCDIEKLILSDEKIRVCRKADRQFVAEMTTRKPA